MQRIDMALLLEDIGATIRTIRRAKGMTQSDVCKKAGYTVNHLSLIESGKRGLSTGALEKIAYALGIPPSFIIVIAEQNDDPILLACKRRVYQEIGIRTIRRRTRRKKLSEV